MEITIAVLAVLLLVAAVVAVQRHHALTAAQRERATLQDQLAEARLTARVAEERAGPAAETARRLFLVTEERDEARETIAALRAEATVQAAATSQREADLLAAREQLSDQFARIGADLLDDAQRKFLDRAEARFTQSENTSGAALKALLDPVHQRLAQYEQGVTQIENDRREAFGNLHGVIETMRAGQDAVRAEAQRIVTALRAAPKARGRWGEQQLRNVLEMCGLSPYADFREEVSVTTDDGRLRPDVVVRIPGGRSLIIDAKVSLNDFLLASDAPDEAARAAALKAHAAAMRKHAMALGAKSYQDQFKDSADFVVMFVPGEHFLSAAQEQDRDLWDDAIQKNVLLAAPTNLIAIARTLATVWRQEKMAEQAREIGALGKEMFERLGTAAQHLNGVGAGLNTAVEKYNRFVGSFEGRVLVTGRKLAELGVETGAQDIVAPREVEILPRELRISPPPANANRHLGIA